MCFFLGKSRNLATVREVGDGEDQHDQEGESRLLNAHEFSWEFWVVRIRLEQEQRKEQRFEFESLFTFVKAGEKSFLSRH